MKEKLLASKHARKTLRAFIEKEYGENADAVWIKTIAQYDSFVTNAPDYGGKKSPHFTQMLNYVMEASIT